MLTHIGYSIAIFETTPSSMAGTVGAIFNGALQLGSAVGIAAISSIETSVERTHGGSESYSGRAAAWWFLVGVVAVEAIAVAMFYRTDSPREIELVESTTTTAVSTPVEEKAEADLGFSTPGNIEKEPAVVTMDNIELEPLPLPLTTLGRSCSEATLTHADSITGKKMPGNPDDIAAKMT